MCAKTYKVSYKENPLKAIAWLQEGNLPDLIISDLNMPEMSGEEFLVYLKANDMFSHIPNYFINSITKYGKEDGMEIVPVMYNRTKNNEYSIPTPIMDEYFTHYKFCLKCTMTY